ncbi:MAG: hypothetical protein U0401_17815 [Anaerolineae bacterium]
MSPKWWRAAGPKALELGADAVFDPQNPGWLDEIRQRTAGWGVDAIIQTVGVPGLIDDLLGLVAPRVGP